MYKWIGEEKVNNIINAILGVVLALVTKAFPKVVLFLFGSFLLLSSVSLRAYVGISLLSVALCLATLRFSLYYTTKEAVRSDSLSSVLQLLTSMSILDLDEEEGEKQNSKGFPPFSDRIARG
ncbi:MAG: hypothetical protein GY861_21840 [bacterium]|nr:hypothetical protein [bacterium]